MNKITVISITLMIMLLGGCSSNSNTEEQQNNNEEVVEEIQEEVKDEVYTKAVIDNNIFTNECLNMKFTPTEDMVMLTQEEVYQAMESGAEILDINNIDDYDLLSELSVTNVLTNESVMIQAEKVKYSAINIDQYIKVLKNQLEDIEEYKFEISDTYAYELCGRTYNTLDAKAEIEGIELNQKYLVSEVGDRFVVISFTYFTEDGLNNMLNCFETLH